MLRRGINPILPVREQITIIDTGHRTHQVYWFEQFIGKKMVAFDIA